MKKLAVCLLVCLFALTLVPADCFAGPWTLKQGKLWSETFVRYSTAKQAFDNEGNRSRWPNGGISEIWDIEQKFEYGATDKLNLLLGIPYSWSRWKNDWNFTQWGSGQTDKNEGFKQINFGAKYKFIEKPIVGAVQLKYYINPPDQDRVQAPDLSDYGDGLDLRFLFGKAFTIQKRPCYVAAEAGYYWTSRYRTKSDFANYIPVFFEMGGSPFDWLMIKGEVDCRFSHQGTGVRKDSITWRVGPIFSLYGRGFSSVKKGGENSVNVELQIGQTAWGRGDGSSEQYRQVSAAWEYVAKLQILF